MYIVIVHFIFIFIIVAYISYFVYKIHKDNKTIFYSIPFEVCSFKKGKDSVYLPIIELSNNNKKFYFLLDSGATLSAIDISVVKNIEHTKLELGGNMYGISGEVLHVDYINATFTHNNISFIDDFQLVEIEGFKNLKNTYGVELAGILGSVFLKSNKCILDYNNNNIKFLV